MAKVTTIIGIEKELNIERGNRERALYALGIYGIVMTLLCIVLVFSVVNRTVIYRTLQGIEKSGEISWKTAELFMKGFLHWMHRYDYRNVEDRTPFITQMVCPSVENEFFAKLEREQKNVSGTNGVQTFEIKEIKPIDIPDGFGFIVQLTRYSNIMKMQTTVYDETYEIVIMQEFNNDGTRNLCVIRHERVKSRTRSA